MANLTLEIAVIGLLLLANGLFALSEMAVVSARRSRLQQRAEAGDRNAQAALELVEQPTRFLSTVQVGITLIGILTGAVGGATLAEEMTPLVARLPGLAPYAEAITFAVVVGIITYFSLIVGELVPKQLALSNPERIAALVARPMNLLSRLAAPLVWLLTISTEGAIRLLRIPPTTEPPVTEQEISVLLEQGTEAGVFEEVEQDLVERVFRLGDRRVRSLMTPQRRVAWLDIEDAWEVNQEKLIEAPHSRFLVCQGSVDQVLGIVLVKDLLTATWRNQPIELPNYLHQPLLVPESLRVLRLLELFKQSALHVAIVIDEYGCVQGLVTLTDVLEALVGELPASDGGAGGEIVQRADGSWLLDGMLPIEELHDHFESLPPLPGEGTESFQTVGGFVVTYMGRLPHPADRCEWEGWQFEVVDMDGNRVDKVLLTPPTPEDDAFSQAVPPTVETPPP